jgi:AI-2 transport protein TqsA
LKSLRLNGEKYLQKLTSQFGNELVYIPFNYRFLLIFDAMNTSTITSGMLIFFGSVIVLIFGQQILVPLMFSVLIYFLIRYINKFIDRIPFFKNKIPSWFKNIFSAIIIFSTLGLITQMMVSNFEYLLKSIPSYQTNLETVLNGINDTFGIDLLKTITEKINTINYSAVLNSVFNSFTSFLGSALMIVFYVVFLFIEQSNFKTKLHLIFHGESYQKVVDILNETEHSITQYIGLKTLISVLTAAASYAVLLAFGVKSSLFWSFLIFVLNFIPYIGSLVAVILPFLFAMIQFGQFGSPFFMLIILVAIQNVIGNLIEPKIMGDSLNISPIVALLSLAFWGAIWGITGMLISVPVTVIMIIIMAKIPKTKSIAILLSHTGKI